MAARPRKTGSKDLPPNLYRKLDARNGVTYYSYRDPVSGRTFGLGTDKQAAIMEAHTQNLDLMGRALPSLAERIASAPRRPFASWIEQYQKDYEKKGLAPSSVRNVRMRLANLVKRFGDQDLGEISTFAVASYLKEMAEAGKAQMARAMRSLLRDVFNEAIAAGWRKENPVDVTKAARVTIQRQRLTLETWRLIYEEARQPWLKRAMELAVLTGQRRDDLARMQFRDVVDGALQVEQSKTGMRLRLSTEIRLECLGLELGEVIRSCRDRVLAKTLIHHSKRVSAAKPGDPLMLDTLSKAFAEARDRAAAKAGITFGDSPPTFHEQRSLAARLHEAEGRSAQALLGHKSSKTTAIYRDSRGAEWVSVA
ncbi:phage integrase Arm DNA-binding domain-containing protein [Pseudomonas oryzihabitans]|uniref:phage integrase Arm DNA-binding domain-containing protein n=1 Tax=Pseudomonas oryzihabitans TaxID=47885 RepID=UPI003D082E05